MSSNNCDVFNLATQFKAGRGAKPTVILASNGGIGYSNKFSQAGAYTSHQSVYGSLQNAYNYDNQATTKSGYQKLQSAYNQQVIGPYSSRL